MNITKTIHAILFAADRVLSVAQLQQLFEEHERPSVDDIERALLNIQTSSADEVWELKKVASGYRIQVQQQYAVHVSRLWDEKPTKYSRALLETLSLVAYRQPITRSEIEDIRGVSVSSNIMRTLQDRGWIRVVGHREVPGRPAIFATTKVFLDYFNLNSLSELPQLMPLRDINEIAAQVDAQIEESSEEVGTEDVDGVYDELHIDIGLESNDSERDGQYE